MIKSVRIYTHRPITVAQLIDFVEEARRIGARDDQVVTIKQAPTNNHPTDRGGEVTVEVSVDTDYRPPIDEKT